MTLKAQSGHRHYAWTIFTCMLVLTLTAGMSSTYSIFMTPVSAAFGCSATEFGLTYTILTYCEVIGAPICARLFKKYSGRLVIGICVLITGLTYLLQGFCTAMWQLYVLNGIQGLVAGLLVLQMSAEFISSWFAVNVATIMGLANCLRGIGGGIWNGLGGWLIDVADWRVTFYIFGGLFLLLSLPFCIPLYKSPAEKGLQPYGIEKVSAAEKDEMAHPTGLPFKRMFKEPAFWGFTIVMAIATFCNVLYGYLNNFLQTEKGMSSTLAGLCNSSLMIAGAVAYIVIGRLCDKRPKLAIWICLGGSVIAYPIMALAGNVGMVGYLVLFALVGLTYQPSCGILWPNIWREMSGKKDYTMSWAFFVSVLNFTGALGSTGWGASIDLFGEQTTFVICAVAYLVMILVALWSFVTARKKWPTYPEWQPEPETAEAK